MANQARGLDAREDGRHTGRTPAQWYCLLAGLGLLLAGVFGWIADASFDTGASADADPGGNANGALQGDSFLGFEVNGWHNLIHLLSAIVLLAAFSRRRPAKTVALAFGLVYGVVTIIGIIDGNDVLGLIPVNPADNVLHIVLSAAGILAALISPTREHDGHDRDVHATRIARGSDDRFGRGAQTAEEPRRSSTVTFHQGEETR
jgi:Domain of unknown function (DUF4383)